MEIALRVDRGYVQFHFKTSLEGSGDALAFLINGVVAGSWTGVNDWTYFSTPVASGRYTFSWRYTKVASETANESRVWIDKIGFPNISGHILYPARDLTSSLEGRNVTLSWSEPFRTSMLTPPPPVILGYHIIQNGLRLNPENQPVSGTTHTIQNSTGGNMMLQIVTVYDQGLSERSNFTNEVLTFGAISSLEGYASAEGIRLNWVFDFDLPTVAGFRVTRNSTNITVPSLPPDTRTFLDPGAGIEPGETYVYTVRAVYINPNGFSPDIHEVTILFVDVADEVSPALITELGNNYPNPFNPETKINFSLKEDTHVRIDVFNIKGQLVETLIDSELTEGRHSVVWSGLDNAGRVSASGIYFYRMTTSDFQSTRKMMLIK
jgi:hypothetical protein